MHLGGQCPLQRCSNRALRLGRAQCKSRQAGETHDGNLLSPLGSSYLHILAGHSLQHVLQLIFLLLRMSLQT